MVTWTFFLAGLFVAVLCGSIWLFVEADDEAAQTAAAVVDAMVAIALGLLAVRGWLARRRRSPTLEQRDKAARWLAGEMRLRVHDEPTHRALLAPEQVAMRWRVRRPVFSPTGTSDSASGLIDTGEGPGALVDWMSRVRSPRAALIGEPGAGKTTLVALIAQELLQSERRDADDPVPVIVSMADWDPRVATLNRWISLRLAEQFPQLTRPEL